MPMNVNPPGQREGGGHMKTWSILAGVICLAIILLVLVLVLRDSEEQEMTGEENIAGWKGEKVIFLPYPVYETHTVEHFGVCSAATYFHLASNPSEKLLTRDYVGRTGTIKEAKKVGYRVKLRIVLDESGEEIIGCGEGPLGFFSELKAAKQMVGRTMWAKGGLNLVTDFDPETPRNTGKTSWVKNTKRVLVTKVEWGSERDPIHFFVRTDDGLEGFIFYFGTTRVSFDDRFCFAPCRSPELLFFNEDPRTQYTEWSDAIWELIENGEVAVGMTEEMVRLACPGGKLRKFGSLLSDDSQSVAPIYLCFPTMQRFTIENEKVTRIGLR
jgi:hypothetical protein